MKKKKKNPSPARRASEDKVSGPVQIELISDPALSAAPPAAEREPAANSERAALPTDEMKPEPSAEVGKPLTSEALAEPEPIVAHAPEPETEPVIAPAREAKARPVAPEPRAESAATPAPVMKFEPPPKPVPLTQAQPVARPGSPASKPVSPQKPVEAEAAAASAASAEEATPKAPEINGYEFLRLLERTSSGEMWIARRRSARLLAVHVVARDRFANEADYDNAFEAVRAYEPLSRGHIGFAGVLQSGRTTKCLYYTTALPDDLKTRRALPAACPESMIAAYSPRTLQSTLAHRGTWPMDEVLRLGISLTVTLQTLHAEGRAYGAVRPEHVVFINGEPKLGGPDFETIAGRPAVRSAFVAPEGPGTPRADLYSLGQVLHEASKGRDDPAAGAEAATDAAWSAQWRRVLAKACAESPARRYQTAQEFQNELVGLLSARLAQRKFWTPAKALALAALFVAAGAAVVIQMFPDKPAAPTTASAEQATSAHVAETAAAGKPLPDISPDGAAIPPQPATPPEAAASGPRVAARSGIPVAEPPQAAPISAPAISETLPPIAAGPIPIQPPAQGPNGGEPGDLATTPAVPSATSPANASAAPQEFAALTSATKTSEPKEPQPEPMQPGKPWTNSLGMKFVPVGEVNFCVWETRVKDYEAFCKATRRLRQRALYEETENHPVVKVSWSDARAFCAWLTQNENAAGILPEGYSYRLPIDLEWSSAAGLSNEVGKTPEARDGKVKKAFPWGSSWPPPRGAGNFADTAARREKSVIIGGYSDGFARTAPVGSFRSNRAGLFDLAGNVWEWCEDTYSSGGSYRVARGGSWVDAKPSDLASSYRNPVAPDTRSLLHGFRCVLAKTSP